MHILYLLKSASSLKIILCILIQTFKNVRVSYETVYLNIYICIFNNLNGENNYYSLITKF